MKIVFAADGSRCTKKALAFLVNHESLAGPDNDIVVLNVQPPVPTRMRSALGAQSVRQWQQEEAEKVLAPIRRFLDRHGVRYRCEWQAGHPHEQILKVVVRTRAEMVVMGTHGHGALGRVLMGSVAQKVVNGAEVPVLLIK